MKNLVIIAMKNSGKSTLAKNLAKAYNMQLFGIDTEIEKLHAEKKQEQFTCREIFKTYGKEYFTSLEKEVIATFCNSNPTNTIIDSSGSAPFQEENRKLLKQIGAILWLRVDPKITYQRLMQNGIPAFFKYPDDPQRSFDELWTEREPVYKAFADYTLEATNETPEELVEKVKQMGIL